MFVKEEEAVLWRGDFVCTWPDDAAFRIVSYGSDCWPDCT